jgi:hypothetical protein
MGSVSSSLNPGVANLLQTLTNINSPVASSPTLASALQKAPASDIVQLSAEATQLESVDALFAISSPTTSNVTNMDTLFGLPAQSTSGTNSVFQAMENAGATLSPTEQAASDQATLQSQLTQGLFDSGTNITGTLLNTLG